MNLQQWIEHPDLLNRETLYELHNILARYPYFQTARLLYLKNLYLLHDINFGPELRAAALYITDRSMLFRQIEGHQYIIEAVTGNISEMPEEAGLDRTLTLIDAFLSSLPKEQTQPVPFDLPNDYSAYLLKEEKEQENKNVIREIPKLRGQELIDGFIEKAEHEPVLYSGKPFEEEPYLEPGLPQKEEEEEEDESCFTETLAKIYIKQKRYEKALEIIKKLSLKYPKKNAYFADQIRFLEKLIINTKSK